jgi:hypothetical protein
VLLGLGEPIRELPELPRRCRARRARVRVSRPAASCVGPAFDAGGDAPRGALAATAAFARGRCSCSPTTPLAPTRSTINFLWTTFTTRFDPAATSTRGASSSVHAQPPSFTPPILNRRAPHAGLSGGLSCDPDTARRVDHAEGVLPAGGVHMGDSERGHLDR